MSARRVRQQLAALQQQHKASESLHQTVAPKKKRIRPRNKRKLATKAQNVNAQQGTQDHLEQNLAYFKATLHSKATEKAAAVMTEV